VLTKTATTKIKNNGSSFFQKWISPQTASRNIKILQKSNFSTLASIEKNPRRGGFHCGRQGVRQFAKLFTNLLYRIPHRKVGQSGRRIA